MIEVSDEAWKNTSCVDCFFAKHAGLRGNELYLCRRYPPTVVPRDPWAKALYPVVNATTPICGEFKWR